MHALAAGLRVFAQCAWRCSRHTSGTAIADETAFVEKFDEGVFAVASDGARIADRGRCIRIIGFVGNGVTC